jgi:hypothetical protein
MIDDQALQGDVGGGLIPGLLQLSPRLPDEAKRNMPENDEQPGRQVDACPWPPPRFRRAPPSG